MGPWSGSGVTEACKIQWFLWRRVSRSKWEFLRPCLPAPGRLRAGQGSSALCDSLGAFEADLCDNRPSWLRPLSTAGQSESTWLRRQPGEPPPGAGRGGRIFTPAASSSASQGTCGGFLYLLQLPSLVWESSSGLGRRKSRPSGDSNRWEAQPPGGCLIAAWPWAEKLPSGSLRPTRPSFFPGWRPAVHVPVRASEVPVPEKDVCNREGMNEHWGAFPSIPSPA